MPQLTLAQAFARGTKKSGSEKQPPPKQPNAAPKPQPSKPQITPPSPAQKILFGPSGPYAEFDQFAVHPITHNGVIYPTSQHLFQALKFIGHRPDIAALIREATTAQLAFDIAHSNKPLARVDWFSVNVSQMEEVLFLKFTQYDHLKQQLIATGNAGLCQDSMTDSFWSVGPDLLGSNELGRALERVRERLGGSPAPVYTIAQCLKCRKRPASGELLYCGMACLRADISRVPPICPRCRRRPQIGDLGFCGVTCLKASRE
ncbi:DUF1768 domain-containing protein [Mycena indigotica]|uniref:DUF1768 domain-containing protein n=1 Tax=Mycena indigotica TaxID=2126181 RepID=A0A8H6T5I9_9AGAR|nr:DUF1768 domain-containing protein [Mycena indigotica]KAF7309805.1 DUF1768 domain-containing protein [Mycena indigotica]